eukprot:CAMPEP_0198684434 /NCGR_PEP_ID=MMETSP1468-20131203/12212_1 /TAXON_ID=1461545 /ORGANISM="Mantoniella sp, Strain CCMP1436" /LENGTH=962 /DNA_ID=CAMNT_0044429247 /DNA_START=42 /DNA_END=2931 /DNA_ORIENTATION=+
MPGFSSLARRGGASMYLVCKYCWAWTYILVDRKVQLSLLLISAALIILLGGLWVWCVAEADDTTYSDGTWAAFTWLAGGVLGGFIDAPANCGARIAAGVVALFSILYSSVVLGLVFEAVQAGMSDLRKGRSLSDLTKEHTVMLGFNVKSLVFIKEIINANGSNAKASKGRFIIAVLCAEEKDTMERELALTISEKDRNGTTILFLQGHPQMVSDLNKVSVTTARSVVVMSNMLLEPNKADAEVLQIVISLNDMELKGHIVAEVRDKNNEPLIHCIGRHNIDLILTHDMSRLMLMSVRHPLLAGLYDSVLGFGHNSFYLTRCPLELVGCKFGDVQQRMPKAIPIGIRCPGETGVMCLNPALIYKLKKDDELVLIANGNEAYAEVVGNSEQEIFAVKRHQREPMEAQPEHIFFAGWRRDLSEFIRLFDTMCPKGSEIHIMAGVPRSQRDARLNLVIKSLTSIKQLHHYVGDVAVRKHLIEAIGNDVIMTFTSCIIFADEDGDIMQSDSKCLNTLELIQDIRKGIHPQSSSTHGTCKSSIEDASDGNMDPKGILSSNAVEYDKPDIPIVTEILDPRTQQAIKNHTNMRVFDFLQSNDMISKILAMVCEDRITKPILDQMLRPDGVSLACVDAREYMDVGEELTMFEMASRCQQSYGEIFLGYLKPSRKVRQPPPIQSEFTGYTPLQLVNTLTFEKKSKQRAWTGFVCCVLRGGNAGSNADVERHKVWVQRDLLFLPRTQLPSYLFCNLNEAWTANLKVAPDRDINASIDDPLEPLAPRTTTPIQPPPSHTSEIDKRSAEKIWERIIIVIFFATPVYTFKTLPLPIAVQMNLHSLTDLPFRVSKSKQVSPPPSNYNVCILPLMEAENAEKANNKVHIVSKVVNYEDDHEAYRGELYGARAELKINPLEGTFRPEWETRLDDLDRKLDAVVDKLGILIEPSNPAPALSVARDPTEFPKASAGTREHT